MASRASADDSRPRSRRRVLAPFVAACLGVALLAGTCGPSGWKGSGLAVAYRATPGAAYVLDGSDKVEVDGLERLLRAIGRIPVVVHDIDPATIGQSLVWVPESARNDSAVAARLLQALDGGAHVVLSGPSTAAIRLGFQFGPQHVRLTGERYQASPELAVTWSKPRTTYEVHDPRDDYVAATTPDGRSPVAISGSHGKGRFLWLAVGAGIAGVERYPLLPLMLRDLLHEAPSPVGRQGIDLYVDPGSLHGAAPDDLAVEWRAEGVRRIYLAGWEFGFETGNADYDAYIDAAHRHGIAAYAWLAPPVVNDPFYAAHPECHELTATGAEATGDWRKLVALEDPHCMDLALAAYGSLLSAHDWDGVNVAELYFEGPLAGASRPDLFTPMSAWARADFRAVAGFDPAALFDPKSSHYAKRSKSSLARFMEYRTDLIVSLHRTLVTALARDLPGTDGAASVVVTTIDDKLAPKTADNVGVDVEKLQDLARTMHFELQYEDPFTVWTLGPRRYDEIRALYPVGTVFDVNAVARPAGAPTSVPTGSELLVTLGSAAGQAGSVALYTDGAVAPLDAPWLPGSVGSAATAVPVPATEAATTAFDVRTPFAVWVQAPAGTRSVSVDSQAWPLFNGTRALVTRGEHRVAFSPAAAPGPVLAVQSCSCEISVARTDAGSVLLFYTSASRAWLALGAVPAHVLVEGVDLPITSVPGGGATVALPAGEHTISVTLP